MKYRYCLSFFLFALLYSCDSTEVIDVNSYELKNEFLVIRTRSQVFNNDKKELLSENKDTINFIVDNEYFLSIMFERECSEGRMKNTDADKQIFFEQSKKLWREKVSLQQRLLDSLGAYRDTLFFKANCNIKDWNRNVFSSTDFKFGWPYMMTDEKAGQQILFLDDLASKKLHDTITFELYYANYWETVKKDIEERMKSKVNPADIGPRVRCSGRVRTTSFSAKSGSRESYTSCSAYTNSKSGRCSYH